MEEGHKNNKKKVVLSIVVIILFLLVAAAIYFFQFNTGGYLLSVPYRRSFVEIADNVYINRDNKRDKNEILDLINRLNNGEDFKSAYGK